jgi:uncharacterized protein (TIGR02646 family)
VCYGLVRDKLALDQAALCAYCEIDPEANNQQIAHFHPKSDRTGGTNWALEWPNLWLACKGGSQSWMSDRGNYSPPLPENLSCDEAKGNEILDGLVLAPRDVPAFPRIFRYEQQPDFVVIAIDEEGCRAAGIDETRVRLTIEKSNLNCPRLGEARLALLREVENQVKRLRESAHDPKSFVELLVQRFLSKDGSGRWRRFFTLVRWRFGKTAESYLTSIGYQG